MRKSGHYWSQIFKKEEEWNTNTIYIFGEFYFIFENQKHHNQITLYTIIG